MSGRRKHPRYGMSNCDGTLRVASDVMALPDDRQDFSVISDEARVRGEVLTIQLVSSPVTSARVHVAESRPIIDNGSLRHWLRLVRLPPQDRPTPGDGDRA